MSTLFDNAAVTHGQDKLVINALSRFWHFIRRDTYVWSFDALYMPGFYEILTLQDQQSQRLRDQHADPADGA